jgi:hypothetical protein
VRLPQTHQILTAWRGAGEDSLVWAASANFDGAAWTDQTTLPNGRRTDDRGALGLLGERVFMAWPGNRYRRTHLVVRAWRRLDAAAARWQRLGEFHARGPRWLSTPTGSLWPGMGLAENRNLSGARFDGATWTYPEAFPGGSTHGPSLASRLGQVIMAWKGGRRSAVARDVRRQLVGPAPGDWSVEPRPGTGLGGQPGRHGVEWHGRGQGNLVDPRRLPDRTPDVRRIHHQRESDPGAYRLRQLVRSNFWAGCPADSASAPAHRAARQQPGSKPITAGLKRGCDRCAA